MPKSSPKLDPATDVVLRRMLATPPQPKVADVFGERDHLRSANQVERHRCSDSTEKVS